MKKIILIVLLTAGVVFSTHSQTKSQDIVRLLEITNTKAQAAQMFDLMMPSMLAAVPDVPSAFWTTFKSLLDLESFVNLLIPIYDRHFSHDDIRGLIQFYESPVGKKFIEVTPQITMESYAAGEEWGRKLGQDIVNELIKQGYLK
jgi:hypothetical protein